MNYQISDEPIRLREFGRGVQQLVKHALAVEDREKRTRMAYEIVRIMAVLQPSVKELPDYKKVLWDHLFVISELKLDVDSPYGVPAPEKLVFRRPDRLPYPDADTLYKQYGRNIELMIANAVAMPDGEEKVAYINRIASIMKLFLNEMKRESVPGEVIARHIREISRGRLRVEGDEIVIQKQMLQLRNVPKNDIAPDRKRKRPSLRLQMPVQPPQPQNGGNQGGGGQGGGGQGGGGQGGGNQGGGNANKNNKWRKRKH